MAGSRQRGEASCARKDPTRRGAALSRGLLAALLGSTVLIAASAAKAQDATWLAAPGSNEITTDANWSTGVTPSSGNTASFGPSSTTSLTVSPFWNVGGITLNANAPQYTFSTTGTIVLDGAGFSVNGGSATVNMSDRAAFLFTNGSSAGTSIINNEATNTRFGLRFQDNSSAGNATITNSSGGFTIFADNGTAANATITATSSGAVISFVGSSTAANATITASSGARTVFGETSTAGNATITTASGGQTYFIDSGTAGNAVITTQSGGVTSFNYSSAGGTSRHIIDAGGLVDFSFYMLATGTLGSIEGAGTVNMSGFSVPVSLTVGGNNLSTTFSGNLIGSGSRFIKDGTGTLTLTGNANTYSGGTVISAGTLQLGNGGTSGSIAGDITDNATLALNRSDTVTFANLISGSGALQQIGSGTTILTAASTYTGSTTVAAGTLEVDGDIHTSSGVTVNSTGTLSGTGTVPTVTINNGGTLAPGNSIGTLNVSGNLRFNAGATYAVEVSPAAADKTVATGTASLTGGTVQATFQAGSYLTKHYAILSSAGLGGTTFAGLNTVSLPTGFNAALSYSATDVVLDLTATLGAISGAGLTGNQQGVAGTLNNFFNNGGTLPPGFVTLFGLTGGALGNGLDQVSGQGSAGGTQTAFNAAGQFMNTISSDGGSDSAGSALGYADEAMAYASGRSPQARDAYAAVTPRDRRAPFEGRWSVWASGYGGSSTVNGDAGAGTQATASRIYGTAVGADYRVGRDIRLGFAMGGAGTNFNTSGGLGGGRADLLQLGVHGRREIGAAYMSGALAYGWQDVTTNRTVTVAGIDKLEAGFKAYSLAARAETGYRFAQLSFGLTPYAALQATSFHLPGYSEHATSGSNQFALTFASQTATNLRSELGARSDKSFLVRDGLLTLRGRAAWAHDSNTDRTVSATFQSLPGTSFTTNGARPSVNAALLTAGAEMTWRHGLSLAGTFESEFSRTTQSYAGKGTVRYAW